MHKKTLLFVVMCLTAICGRAQHDTSSRVITPHVSPALKFTENLGQWGDNILFRATLDGGMLYLEKNCLTFDFYDKKKFRSLHHGGATRGIYKDLDIQCHAYRIHFEGCNPSSFVDRLQAGSDYENFYLGKDKAKWKSNVKNYHQVWLRNLYNGIDYEVFTATNGIKYNFHLQPGANASAIKMRYEGADKLQLKNGALNVSLHVNSVVEQRPYAYQVINGSTVKVPCNYRLNKDVLSFDFPQGYNKSYELVIDPILVFAAQSGSSADNFGMAATFDAQGNLYAGGTVYGNGYPVSIGAYDVSFNGTGGTDVAITKYNATGNALLYSTYFGGTQTEVVSSLIVDYNNNLCFYGATGSPDLPMTSNAYDPTFNGGTGLSFVSNGTTYQFGTDIYIAKFNTSGTSLLASTYLGGSDNDGVNHVNHLTLVQIGPNTWANEYAIDSLQYNYGDQYRGEIQVDVQNNIYITSSTRSSDFPMANAFDNTLGGKQDAIVAKLDPGLSLLTYCSYLGGSANECGNSLIVNSLDEVYVTGGTCSSDFPATTGAASTSYNGGIADGYLAHINTAGNQILQATYVGTTSYDQSYFVQIDQNNRIYIYGQTMGIMPTFNLVTGNPPYNNAGRHQFICRYNSTLSTQNLSTVFGSSTTRVDISPSAFAVDKCNNIYISGWGGNILANNSAMSGMPLFNPTQSSTTGYDFYFMGLSAEAASLTYGSYFGGTVSREHVDGGTSRFDPRGKIYQSVCAGCGGNDDFPVTNGAWPNTPGDPNHAFNCNNGVIKLDFQLQLSVSVINSSSLTGCMPFTVTFTNSGIGGPGSTFKWHLGNNVTNTTTPNPTITYTAPGVYTVALVVNDNSTCNKKDSTTTFVTVHPSPTTNIGAQYSQCSNTVATTHTTTGNLGNNPYAWSFGDNTGVLNMPNPSHQYLNNGTYTISLTVTDKNGCKGTDTRTVTVFDFKPGIAKPDSVCSGSSKILNASGGTNYTWSPGGSLNNSFTASPVASPTANTIYTISIENNSPGYTCARTVTTSLDVNPTPTTNFNFTANPCGGGVHFSDLSVDDVIAWNWQLQSSETSTLQNPYLFYLHGGTYTVTLQSTNIYGCKQALNKVLTVAEPEQVAVSGGTIICKKDKVQLNASGGVSYVWTPGASLDISTIANPQASPPASTEYSVEITTGKIMDGKPCNYMLVTRVGVEVLSNDPIDAKASPTKILVGENSTLTYIGDPGATITWFPLGSTIPPTGYAVTGKPDRPTTYTVVAKKGVCTETVTVHVDAYTEGCLSGDVFIPNTFTPNGDGKNDQLYVRGIKVDDVYFAVYNRWGEMVFETKDKEKGWDGVYKGKPADVGVFGWYLKAKCVNGEETFLKGNVTLVR